MEEAKHPFWEEAWFENGHPGMVHDTVAGAKIIGLISPLWHERVVGSKIKAGKLVGIDKDRPHRLNVFFSQRLLFVSI